MSDLQAQAKSLLVGAYDLHTHAEPSHFPRALDDFDLVRGADKYGMRGVMFKCHYEPTTGRAAVANLHAGAKAKAYGSIALNWSVGGLNPFAVESCLKMGGKMVWMPTLDSALFMSTGKGFDPTFMPRPGLTVLDEAGKLLPAVYEIFEVMKKFDTYLATGHLSPTESLLICEEGRKAGVKMILTHPDFARTPIDLETQQKIVKMGVLVEKVWLNVKLGHISPEAFAGSIKKLGPQNCFLTTDRGQKDAELPADAMLEAAAAMLECGLTEADINTIIKTVPEKVLGL